MKSFVAKPAWAMLLAAAILAGPVHAKAPSSDTGQSSAAGKTKKSTAKKAGHAGQIKFVPGSEETPRERSARLQRECRGRVNAGACAGYTY